MGGSTARAILLAGSAFLLATGLVTWRAVDELGAAGVPTVEGWALKDFGDVLYYPGLALVDGYNPYDVPAQVARYPVGAGIVGYAPHTILLHLPFVVLPYRAALWCYFAFVLGLTVLLAALGLRFAGIGAAPARVLAVATFLVLSNPGRLNLLYAQLTLQVVIATHLVLHGTERRPWLAALGVGIALMKPTFGVPLAVLLVLGRGETRVVTLGAALAGAGSLVAMLWLVPAAGGIAAFVRSFIDGLGVLRGEWFNAADSSWTRVDAVAVLGHTLGRPTTFAEEVVIGVTVLGVGVIGLRRLGQENVRLNAPASLTLVCLTLLIFHYQQVYGALLLVLPVLSLAVSREGLPAAPAGPLRWVLVGLMLVPFINVLSAARIVGALGSSSILGRALTSLSGAALVAAWSIMLAPVLAGPRAQLAPLVQASADPGGLDGVDCPRFGGRLTACAISSAGAGSSRS
jgi:Glycosyltransferase family 87